MPLVISGKLSLPITGRPASNAEIRFRAVNSVGEIIQGAESLDRCDASGNYNISLEFARYELATKISTVDFIVHGQVTIDIDTVALDLESLIEQIGLAGELTDELIKEFAQLKAETVAAANEAKQSANEAAADSKIASDAEAAITPMYNYFNASYPAFETNYQDFAVKYPDVVQKHGEVVTLEGQTQAAKDLAEKWASNPENVPVTGAEYSAFHWAEKAKQNANQTFVSGGLFTPAAGNEYPDVSGVSRDTIWIVEFSTHGETYTFTSGQLSGKVTGNGDMIFYDTPNNTWSLIPTAVAAGVISVDGDTGPSVNLESKYYWSGNAPTIANVTGLQAELDAKTTGQDVADKIKEDLPEYTDIVYKASGGNSAVDNMIDGIPIAAKIGDICRADGVEYERVSLSDPAVIEDFELKASSKVVSELPQYPHVLKYTDDNKRLRGILEGKICSFEGETFNITEQIVIDGDKTIRNNYNTAININSQIDSPIVFNGEVNCDGPGKVTVNGNNNDRPAGDAALVAFSEFMPSLENWVFKNSNGAGFLAGRLDFLTTQKGKGSGHLSGCKFESCGKGPHAYGTEANLDTRFDLINCKTDVNCGSKGNILYLSGHQDAKVLYGRYEMDDSCSGPNINKGVSGKYIGSTFKGGLRGPTFGKGQQYGFAGGGGNSIGSLFAAISCDLKRDTDPGDGLFPVGFIEVDNWQATDCNRTMYIQGQQIHFGNIVTRRSISTDYLFRINGASPDRVFQTGSIDVFDTVDASNVQLFNLGEQSKVKLLTSSIDHDLPKDRNIVVSSASPNEIYGQDKIYFYDGDSSANINMPNMVNQIQVKLANSGTTTVRLPKADFSKIYDHYTDIICTNGNNSRVLNLSLTQGSGSLNGSSNTISFRPTTSMPFVVRVYFQGAAYYQAVLLSPDVSIL